MFWQVSKDTLIRLLQKYLIYLLLYTEMIFILILKTCAKTRQGHAVTAGRVKKVRALY